MVRVGALRGGGQRLAVGLRGPEEGRHPADHGDGTGTGRYPFWTVEYLYTYGAPASGSLTQKFLSYMGSFTAKDLVRQEGYTPCVDSTNNLMSTLCAPGAR